MQLHVVAKYTQSYTLKLTYAPVDTQWPKTQHITTHIATKKTVDTNTMPAIAPSVYTKSACNCMGLGDRSART